MSEYQDAMKIFTEEEQLVRDKAKAFDELYHHAILCDKSAENHFKKELTWWGLADLMCTVMDVIRRKD